MSIVPKNKIDLDACKNLRLASDAEVEQHLMELLPWLQDMNWPVATHVCDRLKSIGSPLVEPVAGILSGNDEVWKYWILSSLLNEISCETLRNFKTSLARLALSPTQAEISEELPAFAAQLLSKLETNRMN